MLVIAETNQEKHLYSIYNTVIDEFEIVDKSKNKAISFYKKYRDCSISDAKDMIENCPPFSYMAEIIGINKIKRER
ncbi:MAG: hypothetical protein EOL97_09755 [Spirochaetia bacterium]|nr:hypothetical protein [Spirochaetia bacterium]